jgi:hypothetical protein
MKAIDLFAGWGGFSLGAVERGRADQEDREALQVFGMIRESLINLRRPEDKPTSVERERAEIRNGASHPARLALAAEESIYPCAKCGVLRTKSEGGTIFTVCDACWDANVAARGDQEDPRARIAKLEAALIEACTIAARWFDDYPGEDADRIAALRQLVAAAAAPAIDDGTMESA